MSATEGYFNSRAGTASEAEVPALQRIFVGAEAPTPPPRPEALR